MNNARIKIPFIFKNKKKKEIKEMIEENIYNDNYRDIAIKYYVEEMCQIDIAFQYNVSRKTINRILKKIIQELS